MRRRHLRLIRDALRLLLPLKGRHELALHFSHLRVLSFQDLLLGTNSRSRPVLKKLTTFLLPLLLLLREHLLMLLLLIRLLLLILAHLLLREALRGLLRVLLLLRGREQGVQNII